MSQEEQGRKKRGYWKIWENVVLALDPIVKELGHLPTQLELRMYGLSSLTTAFSKYYCGYIQVARRLGVPTAEEFQLNKLRDWNVFKSQIMPYVKQYGRLPSKAELISLGRSDIANAIRKYHGTMNDVAKRLGVKTYNQYNNLHDIDYWTRERIVKEYIFVIEKHNFEHWPSPSDLRSLGYGGLASSIGKIGYKKLRTLVAELGLHLTDKPRKLDHLIPYETVYDISGDVFKESELKYYFIGIVSADGYIVNGKNDKGVELCHNHADVLLLESLRDRISPDRPIRHKPHKNHDSSAYRVKFNGKEIFDFLSNYMPISNKSYALTYPVNIPKEYLHHYLRGYIDGDGTIGVAKNQQTVNGKRKYYYVTRLRVLGTEAFLKGLTEAIQEALGIKPVKVSKKGKERVYEIQYSGKHANSILDFIYSDLTLLLDRKFHVWNYIRNASQEKLASNYGTRNGQYNRLAKEGKL